MNKSHYYLSSGLWEVVKCYFDDDSKLQNVYFWAMAVAPHCTCFASHVVSTPWQQSWATLKLLEYCISKHGGDFKSDVFTSSDITNVRKEVDFQYTLRNSAEDGFVQALFESYGKFLRHGNCCKLESEILLRSLQELMASLLQTSPSTAHCLARQLSSLLPSMLELPSDNAELSVLLIGAVADPPSLLQILPLTQGAHRRELFLLLLANGQSSLLRRIETEERHQISESALAQLQQLAHHGVNPAELFQTMILTNRHFIISLLDLIEGGPGLTETEHIPKFLWPLLLLRLWGKPDIPEFQIQALIDQCKESTTDQAILRVCLMLEWYLSFSRWSASQGAEKRVGLEAARDHSVLRLIHASADLAQADWAQVRALLHEPWDLQLLDGFSAQILLLRAMVAAASMRRERVRLAEATEAEKRLAVEYHREVTERLQEIQELIRCLKPLRFRLEVLENLFGLLFVTWEDLQGVRLRRHSQAEPRSPGPSRPSGPNRGFVCGPHILRDAVLLIKECTAELEREPKTEQEVHVPCSIKPSQMENRLDRLTESLSEATWRLQLVTSPEFVADVGSVAFCHERHSFEPEWLVDTWQEQGKSKRRSCQEKREESGSQSPASGGETDRGSERPPGPGLMHQMLASDWSLVVRCLSQGDLLNAEHIITMMSTEESRQVVEGELNFTQAVRDVRRKIQSLAESPCRRPSEVPAKTTKKSGGLQAVQQVAAQGVSATALSNHVERFLSTATLPVIQGSSKVSLGSMLQCMENSAAIVTLDLAITASTTYQDFRDLVSLAGKHCPELTTRLQTPLGGAAGSKPLGYISFAQTLMALLHELNKEVAMPPAVFFRTRHSSLSLKTLKEQETLWKQLRALEQEVVKSRRESETSVRDLGRGQKNIKSMQKILENVTKATETSVETLDIGRSEVSTSELAKSVNYTELLNRYLSDLATLSLDFVTTKSDGDDVVTFHSLLEMSAVEVLDRLVFQHLVDPALLEKKAQQLGFNVSASLVWGCCPAVPQGPALPPSLLPLTPDCAILNIPEPTYSCETFGDAKAAVSTILADLLAALATYARNTTTGLDERCVSYLPPAVLEAASTDDIVKAVLQRTQTLAVIDVSALQPSQVFAFYIDLCNLLTLHCLLDTKVRDAFCSEQGLVRGAALWFVGYQLGGFGFVSVAELRRALCGEELSQPFSPRSARTLPLYGLDPDPRALFLVPILQLISPGPRLTLVSSEPVELQLAGAVEAYARRYVVVDGAQIRIPALLDWYLDAVLMLEEAEGSSDGGSARPRRRLQVLMEFLMENSHGGEWHESLKSWSLSDLTLDVDPSECSPTLTLDYCVHDHMLETPRALAAASVAQRWEKRTLSEPIIKQLSQSSRVLADVVARLHEARGDGEGRSLEVGHDALLDERLRCLEALLAAPWVQALAPACLNNAVLAALYKFPPASSLWPYLERCVEEKKWPECCAIFRALPDFGLQNDTNLRRVRDAVLFEMAALTSQSRNESGWIYTQQIADLYVRTESVKVNHCFWPGPVAAKQFSSILRDEPSLPVAAAREIKEAIRKIMVFSAIADSCQDFEYKSWFEVASLSAAMPKTVLQALLRCDQLQLCLEWVSLPGVLEAIVPDIDVSLVIRFATLLPRQLTALFSRLPSERILTLCKDVIPQLTSLVALRSIAELCLEVAEDGEQKLELRKICLGVEMLAALEEEEAAQLAHLVADPLLALEQLIMNTRLDSVAFLLKRLRQLPGNDLIDEKDVNDLLARYASRAVELNVIHVINSSTRENFHVSPAITSNFVVPTEVPDKSDWVPDDQVELCMCCRLVSFSMFNRRHHCRRCGRVICASCSPHRIKVDGYKGVAVRVCQTCHSQHSKPEGDLSVDSVVEDSSVSEDVHHWCLTTDPVRNATVREEFSFEHSPNASLCLAIFSLLPDSPSYTSLLLDESEKLLELLQGRDTAGNPEVDYTVLIQIIRALVVGAKVRYGQAGLATGVVSCDRLLSQVDLISLLVRNHCTRLIPPEPLTGQTMRALRDRLVEEELWDLAIELSTKAGLSLSGVWAAWGKVLLAAGCWGEARQKFSQCLVPAVHHGRSSPLLDEICHIIETTSFSSLRPNASAHEVLELLSSLKGLAGGKAPVRGVGGPGSLQYSEQEWYLTRYGSAAGLLRFYLRHEQWNAALSQLSQRQLEPELFIDSILLPVYRSNAQDRLKAEMVAMDPSLELFKRHLAASCIYLQKTQSLYNLHDLQLFMQDFVRAAMTCIQLYQSKGSSFSHQLQSSDLLQTALRHLEEEISASKKMIGRLEHVMRLDYRDLNRHMNTIWRQLEVSKFMAGCEAASQSLFPLLTSLSWQQAVVPTLFDGQQVRTTLAAACVLAGKNVEEGFGLSFRIIQDYNLDHEEVYTKVGRILGSQGRGADLQQLADCLQTSGAEESTVTCDKVLAAAVAAMASADRLSNVEALVPFITSVDLRISALTDARQLKAAYLLAVKHNRLALIQRIMEEAERAGQNVIRDICRKKLGLAGETGSVCSSAPSGESV